MYDINAQSSIFSLISGYFILGSLISLTFDLPLNENKSYIQTFMEHRYAEMHQMH